MARAKRMPAALAIWRLFIALICFAAGSSVMAQGSGGEQYVAMGSSFAAGPGVRDRDANAPTLCARSSSNYAHLLAAKRGLALDDVTCSGATTANILSDPQAGAPPEIAAVGPLTRLVTLTVGGNDVGYLGELFRQSCLDDTTRSLAPWRPRACLSTPEVDVEQGFARLPGRLLAIVSAIRARSPHATIIFVDYVTILPTKGACPSRSPLTEAQIGQFNAVAARLAAITADVAKSTGAMLVRASALSAGHDVCAEDSWVVPYVQPTNAQVFGPAPYHPNLKAMAAIAAAVDAVLGPSSP